MPIEECEKDQQCRFTKTGAGDSKIRFPILFFLLLLREYFRTRRANRDFRRWTEATPHFWAPWIGTAGAARLTFARRRSRGGVAPVRISPCGKAVEPAKKPTLGTEEPSDGVGRPQLFYWRRPTRRARVSEADLAISDFAARAGCYSTRRPSDLRTPGSITRLTCPGTSSTVQYIPIQKEGSDGGIIVDRLLLYLLLSIT